MIATFCLISIRQIINFFSVVHHEFIKWSIGKRLGSQLIQVFLNLSEFATSFKSGELTALVDYESQASASIMQTHFLATWQVSVSFLMYFVVILMVAPIPALLLIVFLGSISLFLRRFVRQTFNLGEQTVKIRADIFDFISERHSAWKTIKLFNTATMEASNFNRLAQGLVSIRLDIARLVEKMAIVFVPMAIGPVFYTLCFGGIFERKVGTLMMFGVVMLRLILLRNPIKKNQELLAKFDPSLRKIDKILGKSATSEPLPRSEGVKPTFQDKIEFKTCASHMMEKANVEF